jgi:hypothetical protein
VEGNRSRVVNDQYSVIKEVKIMNPLEENLKVWNEFCNFIKSLDDDGVEMFIKHGKETIKNFGSEEVWQDTINKIRKS